MQDKPAYESKTIWAGVLIIILALIQLVGVGELDLKIITELLVGVGFVGLRQSVD